MRNEDSNTHDNDQAKLIPMEKLGTFYADNFVSENKYQPDLYVREWNNIFHIQVIVYLGFFSIRIRHLNLLF